MCVSNISAAAYGNSLMITFSIAPISVLEKKSQLSNGGIHFSAALDLNQALHQKLSFSADVF